jgi:hypothetical protein
MALTIDETPAQPGEWGFRPENMTTEETPPAFVWRPQENAETYDIQCARENGFSAVAYEASGLTYTVHRPPQTFESGQWFWRFRFADGDGNVSDWSSGRGFVIDEDAKALPMPKRSELIRRIPKDHPRLFVRPEQLDDLRARAKSDLKPIYDELVATCEDILADVPPTAEPPLYPDGTVRLSEEWREIWWGNRMYTIRVLNSAATLAFTRLLGGPDHYGEKAKELLLACAQWNPLGATGYRYNDEAGMPYNYYFCRTYSFVNDLLSEKERELCRKVMRVQGQEMYDHLAIEMQYLWHPYGSHAGRAWHFLGEIGVTFLDEIPEAEEWVWFVMNVFGSVYPAWCDEDGGWHQGLGYWASYVQRFTWWADIMTASMGIDAFDKPYFARAGDYAMYLQPPGTRGGGVGDLTTTRRSDQNCDLMATLAAQARNPYWQWYVDQHPTKKRDESVDEAKERRLSAVGAGRSLYIDFVRGALPQVEGRAPSDLPSSKLFRGTGLAVMNFDLTDGENNVEIIFKSSPLGSQSHGFDAQNSFSLFAFGERLLIHTGQRDIHGSDHHKNWMHHTKSTNCITVNGESQLRNNAAAIGEVVMFKTSGPFDYVVGEAAKAYGGKLKRFTRRILFVKPEVVIIYDTLIANETSTFQYHLHAETEMAIDGQTMKITTGDAGCVVSLLHPADLKISQTDQFDPPPRDRIQLKEYHVTAETRTPKKEATFIAVLRPHRIGDVPEGGVVMAEDQVIHIPLSDGKLEVVVDEKLRAGKMNKNGEVVAAFGRVF